MGRFRATVEGNIPFTPAEEEQADIESAAYKAAEPERLKKAAIDKAIREFEAEVAAMTSSYSQAEIDTFPTQEAEANAYAADNTAPTPLLDAIISESGEVKALLVTSILANAAALKIGAGKAIGKKQKKLKS